MLFPVGQHDYNTTAQKLQEGKIKKFGAKGEKKTHGPGNARKTRVKRKELAWDDDKLLKLMAAA